MIPKNYLNILVEQLLLHFFNTPSAAGFFKIPDLHLNDDELPVETLAGFPASFIGDSSLLNCHKLPIVCQ